MWEHGPPSGDAEQMWPLLIQDSPSPSLPTPIALLFISSAPACTGHRDNYPHSEGFNSPLRCLWPPLRQTLTSHTASPAKGGGRVLSCWEVWFSYNIDHKEKTRKHTKKTN